jgi:hypothetical protein
MCGVAECKYMGIFINLAEIGLERVKGYQIVYVNAAAMALRAKSLVQRGRKNYPV